MKTLDDDAKAALRNNKRTIREWDWAHSPCLRIVKRPSLLEAPFDPQDTITMYEVHADKGYFDGRPVWLVYCDGVFVDHQPRYS